MKLQELRKAIKNEIKDNDSLVSYIAYMGDVEERIVSNFIEHAASITDDQLIKMVAEKLLIQDSFDVLIVNK